MSANNQTLVVRGRDGRWYVFGNVMAEAWHQDDGKLTLKARDAITFYEVRELALIWAHDLEEKEPTEYGVHERLAKDGALPEVV